MSDPLASIPLSAIRVFEAAARLGSFTRAAAELGMTQAAVSWQVKALEQRLDQPLFRRLPREVALTPAGERLARAATEAMTALRAAFADLSDSGGGGLSVPPPHTLPNQWPGPRAGAGPPPQPGGGAGAGRVPTRQSGRGRAAGHRDADDGPAARADGRGDPDGAGRLARDGGAPDVPVDDDDPGGAGGRSPARAVTDACRRPHGLKDR